MSPDPLSGGLGLKGSGFGDSVFRVVGLGLSSFRGLEVEGPWFRVPKPQTEVGTGLDSP